MKYFTQIFAVVCFSLTLAYCGYMIALSHRYSCYLYEAKTEFQVQPLVRLDHWTGEYKFISRLEK